MVKRSLFRLLLYYSSLFVLYFVGPSHSFLILSTTPTTSTLTQTRHKRAPTKTTTTTTTTATATTAIKYQLQQRPRPRQRHQVPVPVPVRMLMAMQDDDSQQQQQQQQQDDDSKRNNNVSSTSSSSPQFWMPRQAPMEGFRSRDNSSSSSHSSLDSLLDTIVELQSQKSNSIRIIQDSQIPKDLSTRHINSIVFTLNLPPPPPPPSAATAAAAAPSIQPQPPPPYILAILDQQDRVNVTKLEQVVVELSSSSSSAYSSAYSSSSSSSLSSFWIDGDERRDLLTLAPMDQLVHICGFAAGTIPPIIGLMLTKNRHPPLLTIVEQSLLSSLLLPVDDEHDSDDPPPLKSSFLSPPPSLILRGGGGRLNQSILLSIQTLLGDSSSNSNSNSNSSNHHHRIHVASFRQQPQHQRGNAVGGKSSSYYSWSSSSYRKATRNDGEGERYQKPYFCVAPPDKKLAMEIINSGDDENKDGRSITSSSTSTTTTTTLPPLPKPEWVAVVGRISGVRQMARRLVFCDLAPPLLSSTTGDNAAADDDDDLHPWRSPDHGGGQDMAVQLILGKTLCQQVGVEKGEMIMRRLLKVGQLVMVQGKTNVGNRNSLKNWVSKTSLDIVVFDIQTLHTEEESSSSRSNVGYWSSTSAPTAITAANKNGGTFSESNNNNNNNNKSRNKRAGLPNEDNENNLPFLKLEDMYPETTLDDSVEIVDDQAGIQRFHIQLQEWLRGDETHDGDGDGDNDPDPGRVGLVGIDCEWKPNFLAGDESQPVLLLQICLHDLQQTYLFDLQALLRPLCPNKTESMTKTEEALSDAISLLYKTKRLIKVGFQVHNDLQRLAASYPHIHSFTYVNSVLEISKLGMQTMQMMTTKNTAKLEALLGGGGMRRARVVTSSLIKMTERFVERTLNKEQQISDWSVRPLSAAQIEYAALDAVVTPFITERLLSSVGARFFYNHDDDDDHHDHDQQQEMMMMTPSLGRYEGDSAFTGFLSSWRFILLHAMEDQVPIQRWNAKRLVGDTFLVQQSWTTGESEPQLPTRPTGLKEEMDAPFVDLNGISRIPSHTVSIDRLKIDSILGTWMTKSKERCVMELVNTAGTGTDHSDDLEQKQEQEEEQGERLLSSTTSRSSRSSTQLDFQARSGYIEMENAVVLFVTLPANNNNRKGGGGGGGGGLSRSYPNEWLEDGSILTWFIKEYEWKGGTTRLAQKMMMMMMSDDEEDGINDNNNNNNNDDDNNKKQKKNDVILFVRRGKGIFFCCGRCRVVTLSDFDNKKKMKMNNNNNKERGELLGRDSDQWNIHKLFLLLTDFGRLQENDDFLDLVNPSSSSRRTRQITKSTITGTRRGGGGGRRRDDDDEEQDQHEEEVYY